MGFFAFFKYEVLENMKKTDYSLAKAQMLTSEVYVVFYKINFNFSSNDRIFGNVCKDSMMSQYLDNCKLIGDI